MAIESQRAYFLHQRISGETSLWVSFFTREWGKVDAYFKGGRTPKKQVALEPFTPLWLCLEQHYVRSVENDAPSCALSKLALFSGLYVNEIVHAMLKPMDACPLLFDAYTSALHELAKTETRIQVEPILRRFEHVLLSETGYGLTFDYEGLTGEPIVPDKQYEFKAGIGWIPANTGIYGTQILLIAAQQFEDLTVQKIAKKIYRQAIAHAMEGKVIETRALFM